MVKRFKQLLAPITSALWLMTTLAEPQPSVAAIKLLSATGTAFAHEYVAFAGNVVIVGAVMALTVIDWVRLVELPQLSVTV
jgi:hypothetical protein